MALVGIQGDRFADFTLRGREIRTEDWPDNSIPYQPDENQADDINREFDQTAHGCTLPQFLLLTSYNWHYCQDHIIHDEMSEIKQNFSLSGTATRFRLHKTVVLVGMMGAGKTAVGQALAEQLGVPFLDSDVEIESAANMTISEIFSRDGEAFFRNKETQVIRRLLDEEKGILSTGGGAFLAKGNRQMISQRGVSVWLRVDLNVLWDRVKHKDTRPLLQTVDPFATLSDLYEARVPVYQYADLVADSDSEIAIEDMVGRVVTVLASRTDVLERI